MRLDVTPDELKFVDFDVFRLFLNEFLNSTPQEKRRTLSNLKLMKELRSCEAFLFEKYRNQDITLACTWAFIVQGSARGRAAQLFEIQYCKHQRTI
jgi:hypothetical protein